MPATSACTCRTDSTDCAGSHWCTQAEACRPTSPAGGASTVTLTVMGKATIPYVYSLAAGNTIKQTVHRAYGLTAR
jgi:hypothetical protein